MGPLVFPLRPSRLLSGLSPITDEALTHPSDSDWLMWRRTYNGWGYSPLKQIDKNNVGHLETAWTWSLIPGVSETTPLVHDGVLSYTITAIKIQALDAATGDLLWEYVRKLTPRQLAGSGNQLTKRNMAIYGDYIISATADVHLIALNQKTGALVWDVQVADWDEGGIAFRVVRWSPTARSFREWRGAATLSRADALLLHMTPQPAKSCGAFIPSRRTAKMVIHGMERRLKIDSAPPPGCQVAMIRS